jgi:hypothetical protein
MPLTMVAAGALALTALSVLAERRRNNRRDIEAVGWVPWPLVTILSTIAALFATALAIKFGG